MFEKLKAHWKVNGLNLLLIITTFALGGSLCGFMGRKLLLLTGLEKGFFWFLFYMILVTLLWPFCVLIISIPLGQFSFFKKYIMKIWKKMTGSKKKNSVTPYRVAIFASGAGSNALKIIQHFKVPCNITLALIVCNNPKAGVLEIAKSNNIPTLIIEKDRFLNGDIYLSKLKSHQINFIVLAGFLWKVPAVLINAFPKKIINIHPALLPKHAGAGMYGNKVHEAVIAAKDSESGISIHYVDELYDHGEIIFQAKCMVEANETAQTLAQKIHALEHQHYPHVIENLLKK